MRLQGPEECSRHRPQAGGCRSTGRARRSPPALPAGRTGSARPLPCLLEPQVGPRLAISTSLPGEAQTRVSRLPQNEASAAERKDRGPRSHSNHLYAGWSHGPPQPPRKTPTHTDMEHVPKRPSVHGVAPTADEKSGIKSDARLNLYNNNPASCPR